MRDLQLSIDIVLVVAWLRCGQPKREGVLRISAIHCVHCLFCNAPVIKIPLKKAFSMYLAHSLSSRFVIASTLIFGVGCASQIVNLPSKSVLKSPLTLDKQRGGGSDRFGSPY